MARGKENKAKEELNNKKRSIDEIKGNLDGIIIKKQKLENISKEEEKRKRRALEAKKKQTYDKMCNETKIKVQLEQEHKQLDERLAQTVKQIKTETKEPEIVFKDNIIAISEKIRKNIENSTKSLNKLEIELETKRKAENPFVISERNHKKQIEEQTRLIESLEKELNKSKINMNIYVDLTSAFDAKGIPSFVLDGVLNEVSMKCTHYLQYLSPHMSLCLTATSKDKNSQNKNNTGPEKVLKVIYFYLFNY